MNHLDRELAALRARVADQDARLRRLPARLGVSVGVQPTLTLVILNGNLVGGGLLGILYSGSVTLSAAPDLAADTTVPNGLGRALLYVNGVPQGRVWARHDRGADVAPLPAGARRQAVDDPVSISYGAGSISAYRWDY